jgi:hypothetical protein
LEAVVDVAAEVGKAEGAICEIRARQRGGRIGKVRVKEGGTSRRRMEQSDLMTRVGLPGKNDGLVGRRKVSNAARGVSNVMGSKEDGAGIRNNKGAGAGGQVGERATTKATETSRKLQEVAGIGRKRGGTG